MTVFVVQSLLLHSIVFILGCLVGVVLHKLLATKSADAIAVSELTTKQEVEEPKSASAPKPAQAVKSVPEKQPAPQPSLENEVVAEPPAEQDDLKRIRGIGPQNETRLNSIGVYTFAQIAAWSKTEQAEIGERLAFSGRIEREDWVEQAQILAKGESTDFADRVDRGEVESSTGDVSESDQGIMPQMLESEPETGRDDLTMIGGIGSAIEKKLFAVGIYTYEQISRWDGENATWIGNQIGFPGRPEREDWMGEAKVLAKGEMDTPAKKSGRGEIKAKPKS